VGIDRERSPYDPLAWQRSKEARLAMAEVESDAAFASCDHGWVDLTIGEHLSALAGIAMRENISRARHAQRMSPVRTSLMVTALRSFFRYLRHRGVMSKDLAGCVPAVPKWSLSTVPRFSPST
jgi:hypothetical protein